MELIPCSLAGLGDASCEFARCTLLSPLAADCPPGTALVVAFRGEAGNTHQHIGTFAFMNAMILAGLEAWQPSALVLDLRQLRYVWGDEMADTLAIASHWSRRTFPTAVVSSELNNMGLTSLVAQEMGADPREWLFGGINEAVAGADQQLVRSTAKLGAAPNHNSE